MGLTPNQILDLAPDASSRKSGSDLGQARKWATLGTDGRIVWGEIQGSGSTPYRAAADVGDGASKCSCPSRKFPCKHGLGLLLAHASSPGAFQSGDPPDWAAKWVQGRDVRAGRAEQPEAKPVDEKARAKRSEAREGKVRDGAAELDLWIRDALRRGLVGVRSEPSAFYERMASRLVDAQAPGLAQAVLRFQSYADGVAWPGFSRDETFALAAARLGIAARALLDEALPEEVRHDLREFAGIPCPADRVAAIEPIADAWAVAGAIVEPEGKVAKRQVWLAGARTGRIAVIVDWGRPLGPAPMPGMDFEGAVRLHPGTGGRCSLAERADAAPAWPEAGPIQAALDAFAHALGRRPWTDAVPVHVGGVRLGRMGEATALSDGSLAMPLAGRRTRAFVDASAGRTCSVFGLWNGRALVPLSLARDGRRYAAGPEVGGDDLARVA